MTSSSPAVHTVSVVVPVYRGATSLPTVLAELDRFSSPFPTPGGHEAVISEVLLVFDHGPDDSARVMRDLAARYDYVRPVWLSRNFGQHAATLAGMASSGGDWVVTLDEDGQYDPADIGSFLDAALAAQATVVYAAPVNQAPHGWLRRRASRGAKHLVDLLTGQGRARSYHSYRLVLGELARSVAAYAGSGVYLDVALGWVAGEVTTAPTRLRSELRSSGYSPLRLLSHFWRLVLTSGTRGLRLVTAGGVVIAVGGIVTAIVLALRQAVTGSVPAGWTSLMVVVLVMSGLVVFFLGVVAEYVGVAVGMAMGRPPYLITSDPAVGPLGRGMGPRAPTGRPGGGDGA